MGYFGNHTCVNCGREITFTEGKKLKGDGNYICHACLDKLQTMLYQEVADHDYDTYLAYKEYSDYSRNELYPIFRETHSFGSMHFDMNNRLYCFAGLIFSPFSEDTVIFRLDTLQSFEFNFNAEQIKEGFLGDSVKGDVTFAFRSAYPAMGGVKTIKTRASAPAKKKMFSKTFTYEYPRELKSFTNVFMGEFNAVQAEAEAAYEERVREEARRQAYEDARANIRIPAADNVELALATFMFDSLEGLTSDEVKKRRNLLIKVLHPDTGEKDAAAAKKINAAYETLITALAS